MSNLWVTAVTASWEDASQESNLHRLDRAHKWVNQQGDKTSPKGLHIPIPESFGEYGHGECPPVPPDEHWDHLPTKAVNLHQKIVHHQWGVRPHVLHEKLNEHHPDHEPDEDLYDDPDRELPDEPLFVKHQGETHLLDGHHRFVTDRLLGRSHTFGKVYDADDPKEHYTKCYDCQENAEARGEDLE
jgi:hypothetical protein